MSVDDVMEVSTKIGLGNYLEESEDFGSQGGLMSWEEVKEANALETYVFKFGNGYDCWRPQTTKNTWFFSHQKYEARIT